MPAGRRFSDFLREIQQIEKSAARGEAILQAFTRHTPFEAGAVYLRDGRDTPYRLSAKTPQWVAAEILDSEPPDDVTPLGGIIFVPLRTPRECHGAVTLAHSDTHSDDDLETLRVAGALLGAVMTNQRLAHEMREGDFQLKYRLWELESLYDIGLSIAATLNIDDLADEILFRTISLTNARRAALFLRDGSRFKVYRSFGDVRGDFLDDDLAAQVVKQGTPMSFEEGADCIFPGCMAFVALPIKGNNESIGVLAAADRETRDGGIGAFDTNDLRLLSSFASQVGIALENSRLHREALEKQAMERELELAATIQRDILPKSLPDVEGIEVAVLARPARQVGGDYHVFFDREGILTMIVADVAGKSMPAALLVSALHAAVQLLYAEGRELAEIATELNKHIHRWSAENKFITMVLVEIDREAETIRFVNAGHNPSYVISDSGIEQLRSHGLPVGILSTSTYKTQTRPFPAGSVVVLYSDGITEAEDVAGEEFENDRLEQILAQHGKETPSVLRDRIAEAVDAFTLGAPQKDDQTLVIARTAR
jgi:sigma-B regulation protein RsbU (phosphoserine phosphatase)